MSKKDPFEEAIKQSPYRITLFEVGKRFLQARNINTRTWRKILAKEIWIREDVVLAEYEKAKAEWQKTLDQKDVLWRKAITDVVKEAEKRKAEWKQKLQRWFVTFLMIDWRSVGSLNDKQLLAWRHEKKEEFEEALKEVEA